MSCGRRAGGGRFFDTPGEPLAPPKAGRIRRRATLTGSRQPDTDGVNSVVVLGDARRAELLGGVAGRGVLGEGVPTSSLKGSCAGTGAGDCPIPDPLRRIVTKYSGAGAGGGALDPRTRGEEPRAPLRGALTGRGFLHARASGRRDRPPSPRAAPAGRRGPSGPREGAIGPEPSTTRGAVPCERREESLGGIRRGEPARTGRIFAPRGADPEDTTRFARPRREDRPDARLAGGGGPRGAQGPTVGKPSPAEAPSPRACRWPGAQRSSVRRGAPDPLANQLRRRRGSPGGVAEAPRGTSPPTWPPRPTVQPTPRPRSEPAAEREGSSGGRAGRGLGSGPRPWRSRWC